MKFISDYEWLLQRDYTVTQEQKEAFAERVAIKMADGTNESEARSQTYWEMGLRVSRLNEKG